MPRAMPAFNTLSQHYQAKSLDLDGDLLRYGKDGEVLKTVTATEKAARLANAKHKLGLDDKTIRADLLKEKRRRLHVNTQLHRLARPLCCNDKKSGTLRQLIPDIVLNSP